jgi:hypothetical protein
VKLASYLILCLLCCSCSSEIRHKDPEVAKLLWRCRRSIIVCEVHEKPSEQNELPIRELSFTDLSGNNTIAVQTPDSFLGMFPTSDKVDAPLVTVWVGGSAYHIRVFEWEASQFRCILDDGSKIFPVITPENYQSDDIVFLLADYAGGPEDPANWTTRCYRWDNQTMTLIKDIPAGLLFGRVNFFL